MKTIYTCLYTSLLLMLAVTQARAGSVTLPNTFTAGTPAKAAEVNANFAAVKTAADDNDSRIATLESEIATLQTTVTNQNSTINTLQTTVTNQASTINTLQTQLTAVQSSHVMALDPYLTVDTTTDSRGPLVTFSGVNVQVVNGMGSTETVNGLGNLIIGYDEADSTSTYHCTIGFNSSTFKPVVTQSDCSAAGGTWTNTGFKTGSHYLVVGSQNNYSGYGGIVSGYVNTSNYYYANVTGGVDNVASGFNSSVSGGGGNTASGPNTSVSGGYGNTASVSTSSISGGFLNTASGQYSSVSGGSHNTASGQYSSVSGGGGTTAGSGNTASGSYSSILGGAGVTTASTNQTSP